MIYTYGRKCRLDKRAFTVADICSGDGISIRHDATLPQIAPFPSNLIWQREQPSRKDWRIWVQALHLAFGPQLILAIPLGGWLRDPHQPIVHIPYDPALDLLYQPGHHGVWRIFTKLPNALVTNSFTHYTYTRATTTVPPTAFHIAFASPGPAQTLHFQGSSPQPIPQPPAETLSAHLIHLWKDRSWPLHSSVFPDNGQAVAQAIHLGTAHGVCDGSYMSEVSPDFATAAWLLEDSHLLHLHLCRGIVHVSGPPSAANAYRAELQGIHALLMAIKGLCSFHKITTGLVIVGCDNQGALYQSQQTQELTPCSSAHADLIRAIRRICRSIPGISIQFHHVKGHQDDHAITSTLPRLAQLNILADRLAKRSLLRLLQHRQRRVGRLVGDAWSLQVNNTTVTSDPHPQILWHLGYRTAHHYMVEKKAFISPTGFSLINFPALSTALKATSPLY